ncbi:DNRLRE domain-containing protein, partial [Chitinimonas sp.]|uniref:DNRLRE domain-containing protein n=1 Tax=Chitinimonas sp. TaxID=1934313 RepID=UPI002F9420EE
QSATLSLYKTSYYDYIYRAHRLLRDWAEGQVSWNSARVGVAWSTAGAAGAGTDYVATADGQGSAAWSPGWLTIDVTSGVQSMAQSAGSNFGWRLLGVSGNGNNKAFASREYATTSLRPRLVVVYQ